MSRGPGAAGWGAGPPATSLRPWGGRGLSRRAGPEGGRALGVCKGEGECEETTSGRRWCRVLSPRPQLLQPRSERVAEYGAPGPPSFSLELYSRFRLRRGSAKRREVNDIPTPAVAAIGFRPSAVRTRGAPLRAAKSSEVWRAVGEAGPRAASRTIRTHRPFPSLPSCTRPGAARRLECGEVALG